MNPLFVSLKHRNYRLFFFGQVISLTGSWLQITAMPWLVYRLTGSSLVLGAVTFLSQIFILLLAPFAGAFADCQDRRRLLFFTQGLLMAQAVALAVLTASGHAAVWQIAVLAVFSGMINAVDMPVRQAFVLELVDRDTLMNAIGLNSMTFNTARVIGPALAGLLIGAFGEHVCFVINAASFLPVLAALALIRTAAPAACDPGQSLGRRFSGGMRTVFARRDLGGMLILLAAAGAAAAFPLVLVPIFAKDILHAGPSTMGVLMAGLGLGAIAATALIAVRNSPGGIRGAAARSAVLLGLGLALFGLVHGLIPVIAALAVVGFASIMQFGLTNTYIQFNSPPEMRGLAMGLLITAFMGFAPIGGLLAGWLAQIAGPGFAAVAGGLMMLLAAAFIYPRIREDI